jgi:predicted RNase H-like nuclease (RuvC/YqgF family)
MEAQTLREEIAKLENELNRRYGEIDELARLIKLKKNSLRELERGKGSRLVGSVRVDHPKVRLSDRAKNSS